MLFSIIVPVYNAEKYLDQCISSVQCQSYPDWELILVDDGSTDASGKMCDSYAEADQRIRVIHVKNGGAAVARKTGCNNSAGDYVGFIDSDDWFTDDCLSKTARAIEINNPDIVAFAACNYFPDGTTTDRPFQFNGFFDKKKIESEIFPFLIQNEKAEYYTSSIWGSFYKRDLISPFMVENSRAVFGEDTASVIPAIYNARNMYFLNEKLYFYRLTSQSLTGSKRVYNWDNPAVIASHIASLIDVHAFDFKEQLDRRIVHDVFNVCLSRFHLKQSYRQIANDIKKNLRTPIYDEAIKQAHFRGNGKAVMMDFTMKHRIIPLIYLEHILRNLRSRR